MEGVISTRGLVNKMVMQALETKIARRQMAYIGHLARYPDERLEKQIMGLWLTPESGGAQKKTRRKKTIRDVYWERIEQFMKKTRIPETQWRRRWTEVAEDKKQWKRYQRRSMQSSS